MKICFFGAGYVGLVIGTCFSEMGNDVVIIDNDKLRIDLLNKGVVPIYELGLKELIERNVKEGRLSFDSSPEKAIKKSEIIFIAVGTPMKEDGSADMSYVYSVAKTIGVNLNGYKVIVDKSTVPVGTAKKVHEIISEKCKNKYGFDIVSNPEFVKEGNAIKDFMVPDRIVVGVKTERAKQIMENLYSCIVRANHPILFTDPQSAEIIKYASNAMLATRISFMNMVANLCEKVGADIKAISRGVGMDNRIGPRFLQAGAGYGGSCFPKDINAFIKTINNNGCDASILESVEIVNQKQKERIIEKVLQTIPEVKGKIITIWGIAFKPKTDDVRKSPSLDLIKKILSEGGVVNAFDPEAEENAKKIFPDVNYFDKPYDALKGSSCLVLMTEWDEFRMLDEKKIKENMVEYNIVDARNVYYGKKFSKEINYVGVGVPKVN